MKTDDGDPTDLIELERELLRGETRADRAALERMLAPDFVEFGSSGLVYSRREVIDVLLSDPRLSEPLRIDAVVKRALSPNVVLLTYVAIGETTGRRVNRSSIWVRDDESWRMAFHQGTPALVEKTSV